MCELNLNPGDIAYVNDGLGRKMYVEIISVKDNGEYVIINLADNIDYVMPSNRNVIEVITAKNMTLHYLKEKQEWEKKFIDLKTENESLHYGASLQSDEISRLEKENERLKTCIKNCPLIAEQIKEEE